MADPILASLPQIFFKEIWSLFMTTWWFWLIIIILALLVKIIPIIINKKFGDEKSQEKCPKCGGDLVEKRKYGRFLACSNYPKCRFTKKID